MRLTRSKDRRRRRAPGRDGAGDADTVPGGHGLIGMRERVALFGGELATGRRNGGGYAVRARLPIAVGGA